MSVETSATLAETSIPAAVITESSPKPSVLIGYKRNSRHTVSGKLKEDEVQDRLYNTLESAKQGKNI